MAQPEEKAPEAATPAKTENEPKAPETSKAPEKAEVVHIVTPVLSKYFQLQQSAFNIHSAILPAGTTKNDITNPRLWNHVGTKIKLHDEIRVMEENGAFMARLLVTFKHSLDHRVKILEYYELEEIDYEEAAGLSDYLIKNRGAVGWCVVDKATGKNLYTNLESQAAALTRRDEHVAAIGK
tara:strand:+ start:5323 stop:5865 length:543 start_codon:yes stop_codon:yes gene_type:complete